MKNKYFKFALCFIIALSCFIWNSDNIVKASVFSVSATNNGDGTATVVISGNCVGGFSVSGGSTTTSVAKSTLDSNASIILNTGKGTFTISVTTISVSDANYNVIENETQNTTVTVTDGTEQEEPTGNSQPDPKPSNPGTSGGTSSGTSNQPETPEVKKSNDANLASLSVSKGTLSPEFSADTTNYSVSLGKDDTTISVEATANDAKATVSGTGEITLQSGDNEITIVVTAEDGTEKHYIIKAMVDETPDVFVTYNGKKLGVVKVLSDIQPPETFEETKVTLDGKEVQAWHSNLRNLTIIYMIDEANEKNFYLYDEASKSITSIYKPLALLGRNVAIVDIPEELQTRSGMKYGEIEVDGQKFMGWTFEASAFENYRLLYLMDEKGKMHYYLYESSENTLQLYSNQAALTQDMVDELNENMELRMILILVLAGTNALTLLLLLIVCIKRRKPKRQTARLEPKYEPEMPQPEEAPEEEEIIPFDAWKYEPMERDTEETTIHLKPYEEEQHLFEQDEEDIHE